MTALKDPVSYVFQVRSYVAVTNPNASDVEKPNRSINGLPWLFKDYSVLDGYTQTVHACTGRLKSVDVEHAFKQSAALAALANTGTATACAIALQLLVPLLQELPFIPLIPI